MRNTKLHRRDFLKMVGSGVAIAPGLQGLTVLAHGTAASRLGPAASVALEGGGDTNLVQTFQSELEALMAGREMSLDFQRVADDGTQDFRIQINEHEFYPVASAFKAFLVLYYFMETPPDEWKTDSQSLVYRTAVYSNNGATGRLIHEMGERVPGDGNAIEKFNDFVTTTLGLENGLYSWNWPNTPTFGFYDPRFEPNDERMVRVRTDTTQLVSNVTTAEDLARGYDFIIHAEEQPQWNNAGFREAIRITREILSIPANDYLSPIEMVVNSGYVGKDGTLPLGDLNVGRVINDAGIIRVPTGQYVISFMSAGENESTTRPVLQQVVDSMRRYEEQFHPSFQVYTSGTSHALYDDGYNYGFVRRQQLELFSEPNEDAPRIDNPVRRNTVFGMMYVMQGAMVRFLPVDDKWGLIVRDDAEDNVFTWSDWTFGFAEANWVASPPKEVYVRIEDLLVMGRDHFEPIDYVTGAGEGTDKYILLDVPRRILTLFEGDTPILKTPIVLNMAATPRGRLYVNRVLLARNMPHYPGVPYTNFLHDGNSLNSGGYALHGAPWHRWSETVTRRETLRRYSHGCINVPNWSRPVGNFDLPVDEFVFRWIGGFPDPANERHHTRTNAPVRIYSHNNIYQEVFEYGAPESVIQHGKNWNDVLHALDERPVDAPESFFEPTLL